MPTRTPAEAFGPLNQIEKKFAPKALYLQGDESLLVARPRVAIVGSRKASDAGISRAAKLARLLAERQVTVVSGLARGVDAAAHTATLQSGGRTIGVIGTGLDRFYPKENRGLQSLIAKEHLLVSQFPEGTPPRPGNFPQRNRTMALVSNASVIVEAGEKSGCHSQAWEALRLGRPLFIMRSVVENERLTWPSALLDYGAYILAEVEELLGILPLGSAPQAAVAF